MADFGLILPSKGSNLNTDYQFFEPLKMGPISRETTPKALKMYFFDGGESADRPTQKMKWSTQHVFMVGKCRQMVADGVEILLLSYNHPIRCLCDLTFRVPKNHRWYHLSRPPCNSQLIVLKISQ